MLTSPGAEFQAISSVLLLKVQPQVLLAPENIATLPTRGDETGGMVQNVPTAAHSCESSFK